MTRLITLPLMLIASVALAQQTSKVTPNTPATIDCEPNCVSKVLPLPHVTTSSELQDVANSFRVLADIKSFFQNASEHTIALNGTAEQVQIAEKLASVFDALHSSSDHSSSIFVSEVKPSAPASTAESVPPNPATNWYSCERNTCLVKVLYLPDLRGTTELQDVVNTLRTIADFQRLVPIPTTHTIGLKGTAEQFAIAERLVTVLEKLRSSGSHNRTSVQFYELHKAVPEPPVSEKLTEERIASLRHTVCEWTTCSMTALYLPAASFEQLQDALNNIRTTAQIQHIVPLQSSHVIVIRGTPEQVALAENLVNQ